MDPAEPLKFTPKDWKVSTPLACQWPASAATGLCEKSYTYWPRREETPANKRQKRRAFIVILPLLDWQLEGIEAKIFLVLSDLSLYGFPTGLPMSKKRTSGRLSE
jgi:hypothetical protein